MDKLDPTTLPDLIETWAKALEALGATVTVERSSAGWTSVCCHSNPFVTEDGKLHHGNINAPGVRPEVDGFTVTTISFTPGKAITYRQLCETCGLPTDAGFMGSSTLGASVYHIEIFWHPQITPMRGRYRDRIVLATTMQEWGPGKNFGHRGRSGVFLELKPDDTLNWGLHG